MSIAVDLADLPAVLAGLDPAAFVCTSDGEARPKIVHALVAVDQDRLTATVGRGTAANVAGGSTVTLIFPGDTPHEMTLLVDAAADVVADARPALSMRPTAAVWHRSAHGAEA